MWNIKSEIMGGFGGKFLGFKNNIEVWYFIDCFLYRKVWIYFKNIIYRFEIVFILIEFVFK